MKILVVIKQVPDMESRFAVAGNGVWYDEADLAYRMNEYDEYAVEQAVQLKEKLGDAEITVLSLGPDRVKEAIKKALAMGGDRGVQIADDQYWDKDPFQVASALAAYAKDKGFDLIFAGMQSQDRGSGQVGILLAEMLGIPSVSTVVEFAFGGSTLQLKRELEGGARAKVAVGLPALVTCQLGLNTPRYPTLPNIMKAKKKELETIPVGDLLKDDKRLVTESMFVPQKSGGAQVLEGDASSVADTLVGILKSKALL